MALQFNQFFQRGAGGWPILADLAHQGANDQDVFTLGEALEGFNGLSSWVAMASNAPWEDWARNAGAARSMMGSWNVDRQGFADVSIQES